MIMKTRKLSRESSIGTETTKTTFTKHDGETPGGPRVKHATRHEISVVAARNRHRNFTCATIDREPQRSRARDSQPHRPRPEASIQEQGREAIRAEPAVHMARSSRPPCAPLQAPQHPSHRHRHPIITYSASIGTKGKIQPLQRSPTAQLHPRHPTPTLAHSTHP